MKSGKYDILRWLNSCGKANFVGHFNMFRENYNKMNRQELGKLLSDSSLDFVQSDNIVTPKIRSASYAMDIFKHGMEWQALKICVESKKLSGEIREQAKLLLSEHEQQDFEKQVYVSISDNRDARKKRLEFSRKIPQKIQIQSNGYKRNPDVVAEVLMRANGKCESCDNDAPFVREHGDMKGRPFLEVHHKRWLSEGGEDSVENAVALCPNCHREEHFGKRKLK